MASPKRTSDLNKSISENNPTEKIELEKIQIPVALIANDDDKDSSLFKNEPSFTYEKSALQQSQVKSLIPDASEGTNNNEQLKNSNIPETILDKYKDKLEKNATQDEPSKIEPESKEKQKELRRQQSLKKRQVEFEMKKIRMELDEWGDRLETLCSVGRFISLLMVAIMTIALLFFLFRSYGDNKFVMWLGLEIADNLAIAFIGFMTIWAINMMELDLGTIMNLSYWLYICCGVHAVLLILGFALMKYSPGFDMSGNRMEQSVTIYKILGIVYILLNVGKIPFFGYWYYLYKNYYPIYEELYDKGMQDGTSRVVIMNKEESVSEGKKESQNAEIKLDEVKLEENKSEVSKSEENK